MVMTYNPKGRSPVVSSMDADDFPMYDHSIEDPGGTGGATVVSGENDVGHITVLPPVRARSCNPVHRRERSRADRIDEGAEEGTPREYRTRFIQKKAGFLFRIICGTIVLRITLRRFT